MDQNHNDTVLIYTDMRMYNDSLIFYAPFSNYIYDQNDSLETEIVKSYNVNVLSNKLARFARVNPETTYVYSSEIKHVPVFVNKYTGKVIEDTEIHSVHSDNFMSINHPMYRQLVFKYIDTLLQNSKKTLKDYLEIIKMNELETNCNTYHLYSSRKIPFGNSVFIDEVKFPLTTVPIEKTSEIHLKLSDIKLFKLPTN
jgi:hypothetical protein